MTTTQGTFQKYALTFMRKGYAVTAVPAGKKKPPLTGTTGRYAPGAAPDGATVHEAADGERHDLNEDDVRKLAAGRGRRMDLALVMRPGTIVLDVDYYDGKNGRATVEALEQRAGVKLPDAPSMRADGRSPLSCRKFFRCAPDVVFRGQAGPDVEVLQASHRYSMGPGSTHPTHGVVRCYDEHGNEIAPEDFPHADDLPVLPEAFVELLQDTVQPGLLDQHDDDGDGVESVPATRRSVDKDTLQAWCDEHDTTHVVVPEHEWRKRLDRIPERLQQFHDKDNDAHGWNGAAHALTLRVTEEAAAGLVPAEEAFSAVENAYLKAAHGHRTNAVLRNEAKSMKRRAVAKVLHDVKTQAAVRRLQVDASLDVLASGERVAIAGDTTTITQAHVTPVSSSRAPFTVHDGGGEGGPAPAHVREQIPQIPESFWKRRPELAHVRQAAAAVRCSPDALLHNVLARLAATSSHQFQVELHEGANLVGLSYFSLNVSPKGYGKTKAAGTARRLIPGPPDGTPFVDERPLGSGEGLVEAFMGKLPVVDDDGNETRRTVRGQVRRNALIRIDEGKKWINLENRKGSTLGDTARSVFVGAPIGEGNAAEETTRIIPAGQYVLGIIMGLQDDLAAGMFTGDNAYNGTPERFAWSSAVDVNMPETRPAFPGPLNLRRPAPEQYAGAGHDTTPENYGVVVIRMPAHVAEEVDAEEVRKHRDFTTRTDDDNDGNHLLLLRMKVAALLALLAGRLNVTDDDWTLAGVVVDTSAQVVTYCKRLALQHEQKDVERRETRAVKLAEKKAKATKAAEAGQAFTLVCGQFARAVHRAHDNGEVLTKANAWRATNGEHRKFTNADDVLEHVTSCGYVVVNPDGTLSAGATEPPKA